MDYSKLTPEEKEFFDKCLISAMNSLICNEKDRIYKNEQQVKSLPNSLAEQAYKYAEAMLKQRQEITNTK